MIATGAALALHRDPMPPGAIPVRRLPAWVRPLRGERYWHQPRSAFRSRPLRRPDRLELYVHFWCGQGRGVAETRLAFAAAPAAELRCGTCVGRRAGFDGRDGLIFRPRDAWALPRRCPGNDKDLRTHQCVACGRVTNWARWPHSGITIHRAEPLLAVRWDPCPWHGWRDMALRSDRMVCTEWQCTTNHGRRG